jgi:hypothetical protein
VAKFLKDPIHRTKVIVRKQPCLPVSRGAVLCDWVWQAAGGHPHRFPYNNFSSVYRIFTKLGHMIPLWKGKYPIYFGVIRSKVKVTVTINRIFDNRVVSARINRILPLPQGNHVAKFVKDPIYRTKVIVRKRPCCQKLYL